MLGPSVLHEFFHLLGFMTDLFGSFRDPHNGMRKLDDGRAKKSVFYTCSETNGHFYVHWNVTRDSTPNVHKFTFPASFVKAVSVRGLAAENCRCPIDPSRTYTDADIEYCMRHPNHCAIAVTSPKVAEKAREYYGCDTLEGQELENAKASCSSIFESHWKLRTLKNEVMNFVGTEPTSFVSPMTLALLEDSGWYQLNYAMATAQIPTGSFGYKSGCEFVAGKCISGTGQVVDDRVFCLPSDAGRRRCSSDALRITRCDAGATGGWEQLRPAGSRSRIAAYDYGTHERQEMYLMDMCPVYEAGANGVCMTGDGHERLGHFGPDSRCLETLDNKAMCVTVACAADRQSYEVVLGSGERHTCLSADDLVTSPRDGDPFLCRDPAVICANWKMRHYLSDSEYRRMPGLKDWRDERDDSIWSSRPDFMSPDTGRSGTKRTGSRSAALGRSGTALALTLVGLQYFRLF
jgi:leishmanolysin-like peptidase